MIAADSERFSPHVLTKARIMVRNNRFEQDPDYPDVWWVQGERAEAPYRVQLGRDRDDPDKVMYATCTCPHGLNKGAGDCRCYHLATVLMVLAEKQDQTGGSRS